MMALRLPAGEAIQIVRRSWPEDASPWDANPSSTRAWAEAALGQLASRADVVLIQTSRGATIGCFQVFGPKGASIALPMGMPVLDRFTWPAWLAAEEREEALTALCTAGITLLPFCPPEVTEGRAGFSLRSHRVAPVVRIRNWAEYEKSRSGSLRRSLRLAHNRMQSRPHQRFEIQVLGVGETARRFPELQHVEMRSRRKQSARVLTRYPHFFQQAFDLLDSEGKMRTLVLFHAGQLIAYQIGFISVDRYLVYQIAFDEEHAYFHPGQVLYDAAIKMAHESGQVADLGNGYSDFKAGFATDYVPLRDVIIASPWIRASLRLPLGALQRFLPYNPAALMLRILSFSGGLLR